MTDLARLPSTTQCHYPPGEDSRTTEKAIRDFRAQRVDKSPKNVSEDGLENAPPTRAGNRAQIRPVVGLISLWSQKLNSWRSAMDSNHRYGLPHHPPQRLSRTWLTPSRASNWSAQKLGLSRSQPFSAGKRLAFYYRDLYETLTGKSLTLCPVSYRADARHRNPAKAEKSPVRLGFVMTGSGLPMSNRLVSPRRTGVVVLIPCHAER